MSALGEIAGKIMMLEVACSWCERRGQYRGAAEAD